MALNSITSQSGGGLGEEVLNEVLDITTGYDIIGKGKAILDDKEMDQMYKLHVAT